MYALGTGEGGPRSPGRPHLYQSADERREARVLYNHQYYTRQKARQAYPPLPPGPYRVLYADPPWHYSSRDPHYHGHARDHYPTLSMAQICALPVKRLVAKSAVLFLWVTAPLLVEACPVLAAWGFTYKTNLVWHKDAHNYGYYLSNEHEHLLLATRGSCKPDIDEKFPSVQRIPRTDHSTKPAAIRLLIETLYPDGRRLELFARSQHAGWDAWGNQAPTDGSATMAPA
jgi:N6-adenosine-specific RNA methylase IME4